MRGGGGGGGGGGERAIDTVCPKFIAGCVVSSCQ